MPPALTQDDGETPWSKFWRVVDAAQNPIQRPEIPVKEDWEERTWSLKAHRLQFPKGGPAPRNIPADLGRNHFEMRLGAYHAAERHCDITDDVLGIVNSLADGEMTTDFDAIRQTFATLPDDHREAIIRNAAEDAGIGAYTDWQGFGPTEEDGEQPRPSLFSPETESLYRASGFRIPVNTYIDANDFETFKALFPLYKQTARTLNVLDDMYG